MSGTEAFPAPTRCPPTSSTVELRRGPHVVDRSELVPWLWMTALVSYLSTSSGWRSGCPCPSATAVREHSLRALVLLSSTSVTRLYDEHGPHVPCGATSTHRLQQFLANRGCLPALLSRLASLSVASPKGPHTLLRFVPRIHCCASGDACALVAI